MPIRPGARRAATPRSPSVAITQPSSAWTNRRTSRPRRSRSSMHIADALAGPVIGVAPAAPGRVDREALRIEQLGRVGAGAGGVERRMLEQPDQLARLAGADRRGARLHLGQRLGIGGQARRHPPFDRRLGDGERDGFRSKLRRSWRLRITSSNRGGKGNGESLDHDRLERNDVVRAARKRGCSFRSPSC